MIKDNAKFRLYWVYKLLQEKYNLTEFDREIKFPPEDYKEMTEETQGLLLPYFLLDTKDTVLDLDHLRYAIRGVEDEINQDRFASLFWEQLHKGEWRRIQGFFEFPSATPFTHTLGEENFQTTLNACGGKEQPSGVVWIPQNAFPSKDGLLVDTLKLELSRYNPHMTKHDCRDKRMLYMEGQCGHLDSVNMHKDIITAFTPYRLLSLPERGFGLAFKLSAFKDCGIEYKNEILVKLYNKGLQEVFRHSMMTPHAKNTWKDALAENMPYYDEHGIWFPRGIFRTAEVNALEIVGHITKTIEIRKNKFYVFMSNTSVFGTKEVSKEWRDTNGI